MPSGAGARRGDKDWHAYCRPQDRLDHISRYPQCAVRDTDESDRFKEDSPVPLIRALFLSVMLGLVPTTYAQAIVLARPDLVVDVLDEPPATGVAGDSFILTPIIKNQGDGAAGASTTTFY